MCDSVFDGALGGLGGASTWRPRVRQLRLAWRMPPRPSPSSRHTTWRGEGLHKHGVLASVRGEVIVEGGGGEGSDGDAYRAVGDGGDEVGDGGAGGGEVKWRR